MGKGAPLRWMENQILRRHLRGTGIEIGALWRRFPVPSRARVWYLDREATEGLQEHYTDIKKFVRPNVVADAVELPFAAGQLDFIIASHVLEHLPLPLPALKRWHDSLAPSGALILRVPDKRFTTDAPRQRTTLEHLLEETAHPERSNDRSHFENWVEHIYHTTPTQPHFETSVLDLIKSGYSIHYHVWTDEDVQQIIDYTISAWKLEWRPLIFWRAHFYRKETIVLLKKAPLTKRPPDA
jgi:SAM-dependent methyltransferase